MAGLALERAVGVVVVFPTLACPPFGTAWADCFTAGELVAVVEP